MEVVVNLLIGLVLERLGQLEELEGIMETLAVLVEI